MSIPISRESSFPKCVEMSRRGSNKPREGLIRSGIQKCAMVFRTRVVASGGAEKRKKICAATTDLAVCCENQTARSADGGVDHDVAHLQPRIERAHSRLSRRPRIVSRSGHGVPSSIHGSQAEKENCGNSCAHTALHGLKHAPRSTTLFSLSLSLFGEGTYARTHGPSGWGTGRGRIH